MARGARFWSVMVATAPVALVLAVVVNLSRQGTHSMMLPLAGSTPPSAMENSLETGSISASRNAAVRIDEVHQLVAVAWECRRRFQQPCRLGERDLGQVVDNGSACSGQPRVLAAIG